MLGRYDGGTCTLNIPHPPVRVLQAPPAHVSPRVIPVYCLVVLQALPALLHLFLRGSGRSKAADEQDTLERRKGGGASDLLRALL